MKTIDLRSDTVTLPTPAMREAMYRAELGDDVFGEDPTVNHLQEMAAERLGKEAALFVSSGTQGNLVAMLTHCGRGEGAIMGHLSHTFTSEQGGAAALGGICYLAVPNQPDGTLDLRTVESAIPSEDIHHPRAKLLCLENTHNFCGGVVLDPAYHAEAYRLAQRHGMALHLDGARIFNAAIARGVPVTEWTRYADSVMFCLSKGLSAPVGSLLCGSKEFIERARRTRKVLGGGMRQAGVLAAAGIVALEQMIDRLAEDHANAHLLAEGIAATPGLYVDLTSVQTNIVFFEVRGTRLTAPQLEQALQGEGVRVLAFNEARLRAVTHYGIERADIEAALQAMRRVLAA